jgi:hypothetical protein
VDSAGTKAATATDGGTIPESHGEIVHTAHGGADIGGVAIDLSRRVLLAPNRCYILVARS